jgi:hypothetical protein
MSPVVFAQSQQPRSEQKKPQVSEKTNPANSKGCLYRGQLFSEGAPKQAEKVEFAKEGKLRYSDAPDGLLMKCVKVGADKFEWQVLRDGDSSPRTLRNQTDK